MRGQQADHLLTRPEIDAQSLCLCHVAVHQKATEEEEGLRVGQEPRVGLVAAADEGIGALKFRAKVLNKFVRAYNEWSIRP